MVDETRDVQTGSGWVKWTLVTLAISGMTIFTVMFASRFADGEDLQKAAIFAIQKKVQSEVKKHYPDAQAASFIKGADILKDKFGDRAKAFQTALDAKVDIAVAEAISRVCGCQTVTPERQARITNLFQRKSSRALKISEKRETFVRGKYDGTVSGLVRDIRIFSGVNIVAFFLIFLLAWVRPKARFHLLLPAGLLPVSAILTICLCIFGQNWFYTSMLGNFWGLFLFIIYGNYLCADVGHHTQSRADHEINSQGDFQC